MGGITQTQLENKLHFEQCCEQKNSFVWSYTDQLQEAMERQAPLLQPLKRNESAIYEAITSVDFGKGTIFVWFVHEAWFTRTKTLLKRALLLPLRCSFRNSRPPTILERSSQASRTKRVQKYGEKLEIMFREKEMRKKKETERKKAGCSRVQQTNSKS